MPPEDVIEQTLKKGKSVSIVALHSGYQYTWWPDMTCVCIMGDYERMEWWRRPTLDCIINSDPDGSFYQIYSDGSIASRNKDGRIYNWGSLDECMRIHGKLINYTLSNRKPQSLVCHCQVNEDTCPSDDDISDVSNDELDRRAWGCY